MSHSKKLFSIIFCTTLLIRAFPVCCGEEVFYKDQEVKQEGPGKMYYSAKTGLHPAFTIAFADAANEKLGTITSGKPSIAAYCGAHQMRS